MRLPPQPERYDRRAEQQRSQAIERELADLRQMLTFVTTGVGAPAFDPPSNGGRLIYIRQDGGTTTTLYVWEGSAWVAK